MQTRLAQVGEAARRGIAVRPMCAVWQGTRDGQSVRSIHRRWMTLPASRPAGASYDPSISSSTAERRSDAADCSSPATRSTSARQHHHYPAVERCFNRLEQRRGITTRFDTTARAYLAGLTLAAALIWTR